jgi:hypothetical protein
MVTTLRVPGRLVLAGGFAVAVAIAPAVGVLAGISSPAVSVTADPNNQSCTFTQSHGSNSLVCTPNSLTAQQNLPSEQGLTNQNMLRHH